MKVFMITWGLLCVFVTVGLFVVYSTDRLPGAPTPQAEYAQILTEAECSPCEENLKRLTKATEGAEVDLHASINAENLAHLKQTTEEFQKVLDRHPRRGAELTEGLSPELLDKAQQLFDKYGMEEGLVRLRESVRRFERPPRKQREHRDPSVDAPDDSP